MVCPGQTHLGAPRVQVQVQGLGEQGGSDVLTHQGGCRRQRWGWRWRFPARNGPVTILHSALKASFAFQHGVKGEIFPQKLILVSLKQNSNRSHRNDKGVGK